MEVANGRGRVQRCKVRIPGSKRAQMEADTVGRESGWWLEAGVEGRRTREVHRDTLVTGSYSLSKSVGEGADTSFEEVSRCHATSSSPDAVAYGTPRLLTASDVMFAISLQ